MKWADNVSRAFGGEGEVVARLCSRNVILIHFRLNNDSAAKSSLAIHVMHFHFQSINNSVRYEIFPIRCAVTTKKRRKMFECESDWRHLICIVGTLEIYVTFFQMIHKRWKTLGAQELRASEIHVNLHHFAFPSVLFYHDPVRNFAWIEINWKFCAMRALRQKALAPLSYFSSHFNLKDFFSGIKIPIQFIFSIASRFCFERHFHLFSLSPSQPYVDTPEDARKSVSS